MGHAEAPDGSIGVLGYSIRSNPDQVGADVKYLVGGLEATRPAIFGSVKLTRISEKLRISLSYRRINHRAAGR
jgi:hypothetical protein